MFLCEIDIFKPTVINIHSTNFFLAAILYVAPGIAPGVEDNLVSKLDQLLLWQCALSNEANRPIK